MTGNMMDFSAFFHCNFRLKKDQTYTVSRVHDDQECFTRAEFDELGMWFCVDPEQDTYITHL